MRLDRSSSSKNSDRSSIHNLAGRTDLARTSDGVAIAENCDRTEWITARSERRLEGGEVGVGTPITAADSTIDKWAEVRFKMASLL